MRKTHRLFVTAGLLFQVLFSVLAAQETGTVVTLCRDAKEPKMDGVMAEGEWTGPVLQGFFDSNSDLMDRRGGWFTLASDGKTLFVAVHSPVHPRYGPLVRNQSHVGIDPEEIIFDDCIEIWMAPGLEGACDYSYRAMFRPLGGGPSQGKFPLMIPGFIRLGWVTGRKVTYRCGEKDSQWTLETAIPLESLDMEAPVKGFRMRVCRNYKIPWATVRSNRGGGYNNAVDNMMVVRLADAAPMVIEPDWVGVKGQEAALIIRNPTKGPLSIVVGDERIDLSAGGEREIPVPIQIGDDGVRQTEVKVTAPDGTILHHRTARWKVSDEPLWEEVL